uniref:Heat shock protein 90 n=1 Tax=Paulinella chromatophora TaxID=39717 RepID=B1X3U9_PAUCH|nr:heat shock protein 90 [Paulinella chromatophora]ACB42618.1 heat shock protein 90 [Paulinella chromatophora]
MVVLEQGQIQIHTENIFPIIKKAVYSGHEVFLRELVSNSVDAINKRRMVAMAGDCQEGDSGKVRIRIDKEHKTLTISDNGIGMTSEEVKKYINQVAFSSAEEFLEKYKGEGDTIIGHFGLGFYSSFMVAKEVDVQTQSAKEGTEPVLWRCDGSPNFTLEVGDRKEAGTDVILHLMEEELEYLETARIRNLITTYCDFMPVPVYLEDEIINKQNALWKKNPRDVTDAEYVEFYRSLYPFQGDPLLWIHLNTDYPYNLQGILYFPRITGRTDWDSGAIRLYCNQVFVSDSIKEIVPRYLLPLRGVIDSPDIPLNVSRSALQTDRRVRSISSFIVKKIGDQLKNLHNTQPKLYAEIWSALAPFIKIGAMEDEKFAEQVIDLILFRTTAKNEQRDKLTTQENDNLTTLTNYRTRLDPAHKDRILYCTDEIAQAGALSLWKSQKAEVLLADMLIDTQFIPWLESRHSSLKFQRVDSEIAENLQLDEESTDEADTASIGEALRTLFKAALSNDNINIQIQALDGEDVPAALILLPEQMRRMNDMGALMEQRLPSLPKNHVLMVNRKHTLIKALQKLEKINSPVSPDVNANQELIGDICRHIYTMARLAVGGLEPKEMVYFQQHSYNLIGSLIEKLI